MLQLTFRQPDGLAGYDVPQEDVQQTALVLAGQQSVQSLLVDLGEGVVGRGEEGEGRELGECLLCDVGGLDGGHQGGELLLPGQGGEDGGGPGGGHRHGSVVSPPSRDKLWVRRIGR